MKLNTTTHASARLEGSAHFTCDMLNQCGGRPTAVRFRVERRVIITDDRQWTDQDQPAVAYMGKIMLSICGVSADRVINFAASERAAERAWKVASRNDETPAGVEETARVFLELIADSCEVRTGEPADGDASWRSVWTALASHWNFTKRPPTIEALFADPLAPIR